VFGVWLRQRFDELVAALVELSVSPHSEDAIRVSLKLLLAYYLVCVEELVELAI